MYSITEYTNPSRPINPLYDEKLTAFCSHVKEEMTILRHKLETLDYTAQRSQSSFVPTSKYEKSIKERETILKEIDSRLQADCPICRKRENPSRTQPPRLRAPKKTLKLVKYYIPKPEQKLTSSDLTTSGFTQSISEKSNTDKSCKTNSDSSGQHTARKQTEIVIPEGEEEKEKIDLQKTSYKVLIRTGLAPKAGTNQPVYISIYGINARLLNHRLIHENARQQFFIPGKTDTFYINNIPTLGNIQQIIIRQENPDLDKGWLLEAVVIIELRTKNRTCFLLKQRLKPVSKEKAKQEDAKKRERELREKRAARLRLSGLSGSRLSEFERRLGLLEDEEEVSSHDTPSDIASDNKSVSEESEKPTFAEVVLQPVEDDRQHKNGARDVDVEDAYGDRDPRDPHDPRQRDHDYLTRERSRLANRKRKETETKRRDLRDLPATYLVEVRTGRAAGTGTDANVFVTLFGNVPVPRSTPQESADASQSQVSELDRLAPQARRYGPRVSPKLSLRTPIQSQVDTEGLFGTREQFGVGPASREALAAQSAGAKKSSKDLFQTGARDRFEHTLPKWLGRIERIRIEHDNAGLAPDWFLEKVTVLDCAEGVLYTFECGEWLRESTGLFRLLLPTRVAKWVQPEQPPDAAFGAPRDAAKAGGSGALGFLRSLDREYEPASRDGAGGFGEKADKREASLERQVRLAEKARAKANQRPRENLTHYEFLIETRPPEPEPEPKVKDLLAADDLRLRSGYEARDTRHLPGERDRLGLIGSPDVHQSLVDAKLNPRREHDEHLKPDLKHSDARQPEQQTSDEKQSPKKAKCTSESQSVLTPSTVIRVRVEGMPTARTQPVAGSASVLGVGAVSAQGAEEQQQQQAGVLSHEFVLRLGQHFKQITRHRALVRLWNQPLIANIRSIRVSCNKELYIERLTICRYLTPSEVKEQMDSYLKHGEKRPEGIRVQKGRMFFKDAKGQFIKVFGKPFAPNIEARALGKFSDHLDLLSGPSFSRHLKRLSGRHQHQKHQRGHKHKHRGEQQNTGAKEGGEQLGNRSRSPSSSSSVSGSRSRSGSESRARAGSSRSGSEEPADGHANGHHHKRESNDQPRHWKQQASDADPGAIDKFYNRLEDQHGLRDLYKRLDPSDPSMRRRERKHRHHHEKQHASSEEKALRGERSRSSSSFSSSSSSQRKKNSQRGHDRGDSEDEAEMSNSSATARERREHRHNKKGELHERRNSIDGTSSTGSSTSSSFASISDADRRHHSKRDQRGTARTAQEGRFVEEDEPAKRHGKRSEHTRQQRRSESASGGASGSESIDERLLARGDGLTHGSGHSKSHHSRRHKHHSNKRQSGSQSQSDSQLHSESESDSESASRFGPRSRSRSGSEASSQSELEHSDSEERSDYDAEERGTYGGRRVSSAPDRRLRRARSEGFLHEPHWQMDALDYRFQARDFSKEQQIHQRRHQKQHHDEHAESPVHEHKHRQHQHDGRGHQKRESERHRNRLGFENPRSGLSKRVEFTDRLELLDMEAQGRHGHHHDASFDRLTPTYLNYLDGFQRHRGEDLFDVGPQEHRRRHRSAESGYLSDSELERRRSLMALRGRRFQIELPYANAYAFYPRCWLMPEQDAQGRSHSFAGAGARVGESRFEYEARELTERDRYSGGGASGRLRAGESGLDHLGRLDRADPYSHRERAGFDGAERDRDRGRYGVGREGRTFDQRGDLYGLGGQKFRMKGTPGWSTEFHCRAQRVLHRSLALTIHFPSPKPFGAANSSGVQLHPERPHSSFAK